MSEPKVPTLPTHAVHFRDNWDGEGDAYLIFAFKCEDIFFSYDTGKPLIEYEGDKILASWELT